MIELEFNDPSFVCTKPISLETSEEEFLFDAGDPIEVKYESPSSDFIIGSGDTVLIIDGQYAKDDLLSSIEVARFEEAEDDSGVFLKNVLDSSGKSTVESLISRMVTLREDLTNESTGRRVRVNKVTSKSLSGE